MFAQDGCCSEQKYSKTCGQVAIMYLGAEYIIGYMGMITYSIELGHE